MPQVIPVTGPAYETVLQQNAQRLINWYLEEDQLGGKHDYILRPTPGLSLFSAIDNKTAIRGMVEHKGVLYVVADNTLYSVDSSGTETSEGTLSTSSGLVKIAKSNDQIMIVDGTKGYIYDVEDDTFAEITDGDFPASPTDVTYQDGYFITISDTDQKFYISQINVGTSWNALDFASATADADNLVACLSDHREIWLFGDKSVEVWFNSGNATFPFERRPGVLLHKGCAARDTVVQVDNTIYWLAKDEQGQSIVVRASGYTPEVITSRAVSQAIEGYTTVSDAQAYAYRDGMHEFYVLTFPTENVTWVYDASTQQWHERESLEGQTYGRHRSNCYAFAYGKHLVGDFNSGNIYQMSTDVFTENSTRIKRVRRTQHVHSNNVLISMYNLVLDVEPGIGLDSGQGSDPQIMLRISKDGGHTWGNELWRTLGKAGIYNHRVKWDFLGIARSWTLEFTITDPVDINILGAYADIEGES